MGCVPPTPQEKLVASPHEPQRAAFDALLQHLGQASIDDAQAILAEREEVEPETDLTPAVLHRVHARLLKTKTERL